MENTDLESINERLEEMEEHFDHINDQLSAQKMFLILAYILPLGIIIIALLWRMNVL